MVKTLLKSVRQYKRVSIETPLFVTMEVILECTIPLIMSKLIDDMTGTSMAPILKYGALLLVLATLSLLFGVLSARAAATAGCGLAKNLRRDLYFKTQDFAFADIDKFSSSSLVTRMTTDVSNVQNAYQMLIRMAVRAPLMTVFSVIMSMSINVRMSFIFLALLPVLAAALFGIFFYVHPIFKRIFKKYDALNNSVQENVGGIRVVKSFVREDYEKEKFENAAEEVRKDFTMAEKILALNNPVMTFCIYVSMLLVSFFGAKLIIGTGGSELSTGELSSLISYGVQILTSMMMLSMVFVMCIISQASAERICQVLNEESTVTNPANPIKEVADGSIEFDNVDFRYSDNSEKPVLDNINLKIRSGMTVGIVGGTGSAKSSLVQLVPRLYDVTDGSLKVGGVDVRDYDMEVLRDQVAMVLQKNVLFSGTIAENLRWGNSNATDEEIRHACQLAQADGFIQEFPDKYDTYIEQGGTNVSGGQRQRLCIARALLKKPKILILDDSTSAVDTKTDKLIREAFHNEIPDTTKIIIAQRIASVQESDMILVMEEGRITASGTHEELLRTCDEYRSIYESQTKNQAQPEELQ